MKSQPSLKLINRARNLNIESFIMRLRNGCTLFVDYEYTRKNKTYRLEFNLWRISKEGPNQYFLTIRAGDPNFVWEPADQRDEKYEFPSPYNAIKFLGEKEYFKISDWGYRKGPFMRKKF